MKNKLIVWTVLLILPIIPVGILYLLFEEMNYFELRDAARGIVAFGPIAAYVVLVLIGYKIYERVSKLSSHKHPAFNKLIGKWEIESTSSHNRTLYGISNITNDGIQLVLAGQLEDDHRERGKSVINWNSEMTRLTDNQFQIFYRISEIKQGTVLKLTGICTLQFGSDPINEMSGLWQVVGREEMLGTISLKRK